MKTSTIKFLLIIIFLAGFAACKIEKKQSMYWETVEVDTAISSNPVYNELDKQEEIFSFGEEIEPNYDSTAKRTSNVLISTEGMGKSDPYARHNNCRANISINDTVRIVIGLSTGFADDGIVITYANSKFHAEPYYWNDAGIEGTQYKMVYQKLILNKTSYKLGDSLYGKIDFQSTQKDRMNLIGKGYFRTKVQKSFVPDK